MEDANLISSIGTFHMNQEVRRVVSGMKDTIGKEEQELAEKSGIETNIGQNEMEDYVKIVLEEASKARK